VGKRSASLRYDVFHKDEKEEMIGMKVIFMELSSLL
jgi:hypothetical protein